MKMPKDLYLKLVDSLNGFDISNDSNVNTIFWLLLRNTNWHSANWFEIRDLGLSDENIRSAVRKYLREEIK